ncbi:MAG: ribosome biogenesis GTPase YlqF [Clostridia bacterium]|nr:ribosome biogenesis GTPase YlqF [Clostridia bacterium]
MINWFPGHMNKTLKQMQNDSKFCDCFVYVVDARCPKSCINPEFVKVCKNKPIIFVLNKADLVEKADIEKAKQYFLSLGHFCVSLNAIVSGSAKIIVSEIKKVFAERIKSNKEKGVNFILRAMVLGVPNSGKSTIVNNLCNKGRAVTGNKAGVTRSKQWVKIDGNIEIMDTPGVLLPNFERDDYAYNLAFVGSVKDEVLNLTDVATRLIARLNEIDCGIIKSKYSVDYDKNTRNIDILELVGKKRGCIIRGGEIDHERAGKVLLTDFRAGKLGRIILE